MNARREHLRAALPRLVVPHTAGEHDLEQSEDQPRAEALIQLGAGPRHGGQE